MGSQFFAYRQHWTHYWSVRVYNRDERRERGRQYHVSSSRTCTPRKGSREAQHRERCAHSLFRLRYSIVCWADSPTVFEMNHPKLTREMAESWTSVFPEINVIVQPAYGTASYA